MLLVTFLFIFAPVLDSPLGPFGDLAAISAVVLVLLHFSYHRTLRWSGLIYLVGLLCLISVSALFGFFLFDSRSGELSVQAIIRPLKGVCFVLGAYCLVEKGIRRGFDFVDFVWCVFIAINIHALIMVAQFIFSDFRELVYSFTEAKHVLEVYQATRMAGLSGAGGAQLSVAQGMGGLLSLYLWMMARNKLDQTKAVLGGFLCFLSVLLCGRSGVLVYAIFGPILLFFGFLLNSSGRHFSLTKSVYGGASVCMLFVGAVVLFSLLMDSEEARYIFFRTFRTFIDYSETGQVKDNTFLAIVNMFHFPDKAEHIIFGRPSYLHLNTYYGINSDIGYIQLLWAYGVIGSILYCVFYLAMVGFVVEKQSLDTLAAVLVLLALGVILFFNAKEVFFLARINFQITLLLFFALILNTGFRQLNLVGQK
jgi:hypothetical protein